MFVQLESGQEYFIEQDFEILGLTGFEDKLQEGVHQCLSEFTEAGIKTWIVTGDKGETARSIGYQCGVLNHDNELIEIDKIEPEDLSGLEKALHPLTNDD